MFDNLRCRPGDVVCITSSTNGMVNPDGWVRWRGLSGISLIMKDIQGYSINSDSDNWIQRL